MLSRKRRLSMVMPNSASTCRMVTTPTPASVARSCWFCGKAIEVVLLGSSPDACETCGRLYSHAITNGLEHEHADSNARPEPDHAAPDPDSPVRLVIPRNAFALPLQHISSLPPRLYAAMKRT